MNISGVPKEQHGKFMGSSQFPKFVNDAEVLRSIPDYISNEDPVVKVSQIKQAIGTVTSPKD